MNRTCAFGSFITLALGGAINEVRSFEANFLMKTEVRKCTTANQFYRNIFACTLHKLYFYKPRASEHRDYLIAHLPNVDSKLVVVHIYKTAQHT